LAAARIWRNAMPSLVSLMGRLRRYLFLITMNTTTPTLNAIVMNTDAIREPEHGAHKPHRWKYPEAHTEHRGPV